MKRKIKKTGIFLASCLQHLEYRRTRQKHGTLDLQEEVYIKIPEIRKRKLEIPKIEKKDWEHAVQDGETVSMKKERIGTRSGNMETKGQRDIYLVTPPVDGTYRLETEQMKKNASVVISVQSLSGQKTEREKECKNAESVTLQLKAGETYFITVAAEEGVWDISDRYLLRKNGKGYFWIYRNSGQHGI